MPINKDTPDVKDKKASNGKAVNFIGLDFRFVFIFVSKMLICLSVEWQRNRRT
jgi:hypothetical protein